MKKPTVVVAVSNLKDWKIRVPGVRVLLAREYLRDPEWSLQRGVRVFNLCRTYRYQSEGYYVSLLASARGQTPIPTLTTLLDMRSRPIVRGVDDDLDELIQRSLAPLRSQEFVLSIYFGVNLAKAYARLATRLFNLFPAPLLRARFARHDRWRLTRIVPIPAREIPVSHVPFVQEAAQRYFEKPRFRAPARRAPPPYHLAILHDPDEKLPPSDPRALKRFARAAERIGFGVEMITREDASRLLEFDALFIRETTWVDHHTYRLAQRAEAEGLAVVDDPQSILRCTNKVFLAEALQLHRVPIPKTKICDRSDVAAIPDAVGLPCVLKIPDSAFSQGVVCCKNREELEREADRILSSSDLLVAQEFLPTEFDWRVGVFEGEPLYACKYHMASGHWQIVKSVSTGSYRHGRVEPVALAEVPARVVRTALKAAKWMGDGLYGVDLKVKGRRCVVMEVNDNPNLDAGLEDGELGDGLYERVMRGILGRVERLKAARR